MNSKRTISILGSTGSVGANTIKVIEKHPDLYDVQVLTANENYKLLAEQAKALNAAHVVIADAKYYDDLKRALSDTDIEIHAGQEALQEITKIPVDLTMAAIVGMAGLPPLLNAIKHSNNVAIANKEPLVSAGTLVMAQASKYGTTILPVDSEHNAIFQIFEQKNRDAIERIILTASGGPFREMPLADMATVTKEQALAHPNWTMGAKISIDSATMMNKALEIIEAHILFDMPVDKIDAIIHPQSVIHSMVEYADGSILAQMGASDMCTPITNVLGWPNRIATPGQKLDIKTLSQLEFESVDDKRFPFVAMAYEAVNKGGAYCLAMNAANEIAVGAFLADKIAFTDIHKIVTKIMEKDHQKALENLNDIMEYDRVTREITESLLSS